MVVEGGGIDDEALELSISSTSHSDGDDDILVVLRVPICYHCGFATFLLRIVKANGQYGVVLRAKQLLPL